MLLNDFESGGFPITKRSPVICALKDGQVKVAYNRFDLKTILMKYDVLSCTGMWPGKKNTDCFKLNPEYYMLAPPEQYKQIDNATEVRLYIDQEGLFEKIEYDIEGITVESEDKKLKNYIQSASLKFKNIFKLEN